MEIKNECKQKEEKKKFVQRSLADIQRAKLNKLMENPVVKNSLILFKSFTMLINFTGQASHNN